MRRVARPAIVATALAAVTFLAPLPAGACSCVVRDLAGQVQAASSVFIGTVRGSAVGSITFDVERLFKGNAASRVRVADPGSACSVPFHASA